MQTSLAKARALGLIWLCILGAGCEDAPSTPKPDIVTQDIAGDAASTDASGADSSGDSLVGQTDATGSDPDAGCAGTCDDDDGNPCTFAVCDAGSCVAKVLADGSVCEDGDPCTTADTCQNGGCKASTAPANNVCGCSTNADCAALDDGLQCNGQLFCDKGAFPYTCKVNPATLPPCESQPPPSPCLVAACAEPTAAGGKAQCTWTPIADGTACDDGNALTEGDTCVQGVCAAGQFVGSCQNNADCAAFEDSSLCNGQLFCNKSKGKCQLNPATVVACPTGQDSTCSKNTCAPATGKCAMQPVADNVPCDDGNSCTTGEVCQQGSCSGATNTCNCTADADCAGQEDGNLCNGTLYCNLAQGKCQLNPATVVQCGDAANPCEALSCQPATGACVAEAKPNGTPCNADNTLCTLADACQAGQCKAGENLCKCAKTADCALFEDGNQCNGQLYCNLQGGVCELNPTSVVSCDSELDTACAKQVCVPLSGECTAVAQNEGGGCDDGDVCTLGDTCVQGSCSAGTAACACATDADCLAQEDGNLCNGTLYCDSQSGLCKVNPATVVNCVDSLPGDCTAVSCNPQTGACLEATADVGAPCEDGNACTAGEICGLGGVCAGGVASCGCDTDADCADFDDGNPCNGTVVCDQAALPYPTCTLTAPVECEELPCQLASCSTATGLCETATATEGSACDDGDPCTEEDSCTNRGCVGASKDCDDDNDCTADICAAGACKHEAVANGLPCEPDLCSTSALCAAGVCAQTPKNCDDADDCTLDSCEASSGQCLHQPTGKPCDDGDACTDGDTCKAAGCAGELITCPDSANACEEIVCESDAGCVTKNMPPGSDCDDGDLCTLGDRCASGVCIGDYIKKCDDGDPCTTDPGCSKALVATGGCSPGQPDNNPMTYWTSDTPNAPNQWGVSRLAYNAIAGTWAAVGAMEGNDPYLRTWGGSNATGVDYTVPYPGRNLPFALAPDGDTGWLIGGLSGPSGDWSEQNATAMLARIAADGQVQWFNNSFAGFGAVADLQLWSDKQPDANAQVLLAGTRSAQNEELAAIMWIAQVEVGSSGPTVVKSGHCDAKSSGMGLYGQKVVRLTDGSMVVAGYGKFDNGEFYENLPVWCRFNSDLELTHGPVFSYDSDSGLGLTTSGLHARPDGGFWLLLAGDGLSIWRAYNAQGELAGDKELPSGAAASLPVGDGMFVGRGDDSGAEVTLEVLGVAIQSDSTLLSRGAAGMIGLVRDPTGIAVLFEDWGVGTVFVHTDAELLNSCTLAQACPGGCDDGNPCTIDFCSSGQCINEIAQCDDENPCTTDSCGVKGCTFAGTTGDPCNDGQECTTQDACANGRCTGTSRFGQTTSKVASTEQIIDGVVHGDGLLVIGKRTVQGATEAFWRKYGPNRNQVGEGVLGTGEPLMLSRTIPHLLGNGVHEATDAVALVMRDEEAALRIVWLEPHTAIVEVVPQVLTDASGFEVRDVIQSGTHLWVSGPEGPGSSNIFGHTRGGSVVQLLGYSPAGHDFVGLIPQEQGWIVASVVSAPNTSLRLDAFDNVWNAIGPPQLFPIESNPPLNGPLCALGAATRGGRMVLCGMGEANWVRLDTGSLQMSSMVDLTFTEAALRGRHVALDSLRVAAVRAESSDGEWTLLLHDGVFNRGSSTSVGFDASAVPVLATSDLDIWLVSETVGGQFREVTVHHLDKYANQSCAGGGGCYQQSCEDGDDCTFSTCSYGLCATPTISAWGNCGLDGPCFQGQCEGGF